MDYKISIITRDQVPTDFFLCGDDGIRAEFKYIYLFEFSNGLKYVIGSYNQITIDEAIEDMEQDYNIAVEYTNNPDELQEYYMDELGIDYIMPICRKIWNYHNNNKELIKQVIDYYKPEELDNIHSADDKGYSKD